MARNAAPSVLNQIVVGFCGAHSGQDQRTEIVRSNSPLQSDGHGDSKSSGNMSLPALGSRIARVTVAITTKNRKHELRSALESLLRQSMPLEILVLDDGSSDGTEAMITNEFPSVRLLRFEQSEG